MAKINKEELEKLSKLARVELTEKESASFQQDIDSILDFVSQVQEVSKEWTGGQKPAGVWGMVENQFREDKNPHEGGIYSKEILDEAPQREGNFFKVKKIL